MRSDPANAGYFYFLTISQYISQLKKLLAAKMRAAIQSISQLVQLAESS